MKISTKYWSTTSNYNFTVIHALKCSLTKTPLFSTDVGIAQLLCHPNSIIDMDNIDISIYSQWKVTNVEYNYSKAQKYTIENYMEKFNKLMFEEEELYEV